MRSRASWAILLLVLLLPPVHGQGSHPAPPTDTTLWLHVDGLQDFAVSPQEPPADFRASFDAGLLTHSNRCLVGPPAPPLLYGTHHTWYGVPGPVHYRADRDGPGLTERGLAYDLELDPGRTPELVWHMSGRSRIAGDDPAPAEAGTVLPGVVLRATLRLGSAVSIDHRALDTGTLLAQAQTAPATLSPLLEGHPNVSYHDDAGTPVYTFRLPIDWQTDRTQVPAATAFNLRVDLFIEAPLCDRPDEAYLMPDALALHTSPGFRPSLTVGVSNPLWVEELRPVLHDDGSVQVQATVASPWGAHDLATPELLLDESPHGGAVRTERSIHSVPPPLWTWDLTPDDAPHTVRLQARSLQGASTDATAHFELGTGRVVSCHGPGPDACTEQHVRATKANRSPAPAVGLVALALLGAALLGVRRST